MMPIKLTRCFCYLEFLLYTYCKSTFIHRFLCLAFITSVHTYLKKKISVNNFVKYFKTLSHSLFAHLDLFACPSVSGSMPNGCWLVQPMEGITWSLEDPGKGGGASLAVTHVSGSGCDP